MNDASQVLIVGITLLAIGAGLLSFGEEWADMTGVISLTAAAFIFLVWLMMVTHYI